MKKILLSACAILVASATFAQQANVAKLQNDIAAEFVMDISSENPVSTPSNSAISSTPFWTNNFDDPTDWVLDNDGQSAPNGWTIDATVDGWWSSNGITSTSGGNFAELTNGDPTATPGSQVLGVTYTMTIASSIDVMALAGTDAVMLSFEEFGARFNDLQEVQISTDGVNYTAVADNLSYTVLSQSGGSAYANPSLRTVNIQPYIAGNASSVWIRFSWTTNYPGSATDPNVWVAYGWYIDDVSLFEVPANLMGIEDAVTGGYWIDYQNYSASGLNSMIGLDYSVTPVDQVAAHPFSCEAVIRNTGAASQSAVLKYDVTGTMAYSGSSVATVLAGSDSVIVAATPTFSPGVGNYVVEMWAEADSAGAGLVTTNSAIETRNIEVSQYLYAKDEGAANQAGSRALGAADDENQISTRYEIYANADLYSLRVFIDDGSTVGSKIYAVIYESDSTASNGVFFLDQSDDYTLTAQDLGNWVDVPFSNPISLFAGYAYECGVGGYQHPIDISEIGMTANPALYNGEHSLFDVTGISTQSAGVPTWYYITSTPMVRMNFDPSTISSVSNIKQSIFNVYPNPSDGVFVIELAAIEKYDVTITNVLGQTVYTTTTSSMETTIDLSNYDKGIYSVELKNDNLTYTEKLIIE
jgi:hypothetical protein